MNKQNEGDGHADAYADYRHLCSLLKELLNINLADESLTRAELVGLLRRLQILCLSHMPV